MLGEAGRVCPVPRQPPNRGDGIPEDEELRQALLPLPAHWQSGEAQEDDEDRSVRFYLVDISGNDDALIVNATIANVMMIRRHSYCSRHQEGPQRAIPDRPVPRGRGRAGQGSQERGTESV